MKKIALVVMLLWGLSSTTFAETDWSEVETVMGKKGSVQEDMLKITFSRTDVKVKVGSVTVDPVLALTSWIGFKKIADNQVMIMGDLVLLDDEVTRVTVMLVKEGLEVTALHNHLFNEKPGIMHLHFNGNGKAKDFAEAIHAALALTGTFTPSKQTAAYNMKNTDWSKVETIFASSGQKRGNLFQLSFPRKGTVQEHGVTLSPFLGLTHSINMQMVDDKAAVTGELVLLADEVQPVVTALLSHNLSITAIHSQMLHESPRLFFLNFYGYDKPETLATLLNAALVKANAK